MEHKETYKCGIFGTLSRVWKLFTGQLPPFEPCCEEHDLAYEQIEDAEDRIWADAHFARCVEEWGWYKTGLVCHFLIRHFGWITWFMRRKKERKK